MANKQRYRFGANDPVRLPVDSGNVVEVGDLIYQATDDARAASSLAASSTLAETQEAFHDSFVGVSADQSRDGDTKDILVHTAGTHEFDCDAATFEVGDLVGPAESSGAAIEDQKVVAVATANLAIGRVAKRYGSNTTKVLVRIVSTVMAGGPQAAA